MKIWQMIAVLVGATIFSVSLILILLNEGKDGCDTDPSLPGCPVTTEVWFCEIIDCGTRGLINTTFAVSSDLGINYWTTRGCTPKDCRRIE